MPCLLQHTYNAKMVIMAKRALIFQKDEYYHIFNKGIDGKSIFKEKEDLLYFLKRLIDLNHTDSSNKVRTARSRDKSLVNVKKDADDRLVEILAYNVLPGHFHLLIKVNEPDDLSKFMHKLSTSYVKYFNAKHARRGSLFQGKFLAHHIMNDKHLCETSVYVNLNHVHHNNGSNICSSIDNYLFKDVVSICTEKEISSLKKIILPKKYLEYAENLAPTLFQDKNTTQKMENL